LRLSDPAWRCTLCSLFFRKDSCAQPPEHGTTGHRFKSISRISLFRLTHQGIFFGGSYAVTAHVRIEICLSNHDGANGRMVGRKPDHQLHAWGGENSPACLGRLLGDCGPLELGIVTRVSSLSGLCVRSSSVPFHGES